MEKEITNAKIAELINNLRGEIEELQNSQGDPKTHLRIIVTRLQSLEDKLGGLRVEVKDLRTVVDRIDEGA